MMKVVILKYNAGNIRSVSYALERLGIHPIITDDIDEINSADKVIFPGVGEAANTMQYLKDKGLDKVIKNLKQPFLGICLGLQLMCNHSEEGDVDCLGIFDTHVRKFISNSPILKVPHMGWNIIEPSDNPLFKGIEKGSYVYFVHSYYAELCDETIAKTPYIKDFSCALHKDNFYAVQFHPEKSADIGSRILQNFLDL
jgi:glutamine amidotransferase